MNIKRSLCGQKLFFAIVLPLENKLYLKTVRSDHFLIPVIAFFWRPFIGLEIHVHDTKWLAVTESPFKVVHKGPQHVPLNINS
ncbi:hypothetical protein D3C85_1369970 [compost metagenome]